MKTTLLYNVRFPVAYHIAIRNTFVTISFCLATIWKRGRENPLNDMVQCSRQ